MAASFEKQPADGGPKAEPMHLRHDSTSRVVIVPADYDLFVLSQREVVQALGERQNRIAQARQTTEDIDETFRTIREWSISRPEVRECFWSPRADDVFIGVVALDEDEGGRLHESMCELDLKLHGRFGFRLHFMLFRASETEDVNSFIDTSSKRVIYTRAFNHGSSSRR